MPLKRHRLWLFWSLLTMTMTGVATYKLFGPDRRMILPGRTTSGHYQIELDCNACHTPWGGVKEQACLDCHAEELKVANDSHPKSKFNDPRNAYRLQLIAADNCVACHREHAPHRTHAMGVTMPEDYCYHCHQQTLTDRPSHKDFGFETCATAGCHNFHDNTALYEGFLLKHGDEPDTRQPALRPLRGLASQLLALRRIEVGTPLAASDQDAPGDRVAMAEIIDDWVSTAHARAGINCMDCHEVKDPTIESKAWSDTLDHSACVECHKEEVAGFMRSKHGMRVSRGLTPMQPALARLPMKSTAAHRALTCVSCHDPHAFDTRRAAVESCLECHDDDHSRSYKASLHFKLFEAELAGDAVPGSGVSCATCHLPREVEVKGETRAVRVQHNQNLNLRPNEKMIRSVCLDCHGLAFSIDALADPALVRANFIGRPARHVESIDLALRRQMEIQQTKSKTRN